MSAATARPDVQYVWGTQYVDDLVVRYRDADASGSSGSPSLEEELYSLADANFNVTAVTENDGDVVERFTYTPYGVSTALDPDFTSYTASDYNWKYRYTTRELDPLTGKQLNRERWYTNLLGRWMNRDPIGYEGGSMSLYEYVAGWPLNYVDPEGQALGTVIVVTYTVGKGISNGILACLNAYNCNKCHQNASKLIQQAANTLGARDPLAFENWLRAAKPGKECGEICVAAGEHALYFAVWMTTGVVWKYGIRFVE